MTADLTGRLWTVQWLPMGYTKLFDNLVHSTVWREPDHIRLVWITMLSLANKHGEVEASVPGLADAARVSIDKCEEALARFHAPDKYSRSQDFEGRRIETMDGGWRLLNYEKYRRRMSVEERRERDAARKRDQRKRDKSGQTRTIADSPQCHNNAEAESREQTHLPPDPPGGRGSGRFNNPQSANQVPLQEWAETLTANPHMAEWCEPHKRDEVVKAAQAFAEAFPGTPPRLRPPRVDTGTRALLEAFAAGFTLEQIVSVMRALVDDPWWNEKNRGLSNLTLEVIRKRIAASPESKLTPKQVEQIKRAKARMEALNQ